MRAEGVLTGKNRPHTGKPCPGVAFGKPHNPSAMRVRAIPVPERQTLDVRQLPRVKALTPLPFLLTQRQAKMTIREGSGHNS